MRRFMNFIAGSLCGALVGSVTALLLAPVSGEEVRNQIRLRTENFRDEVSEAYRARVTQLETDLENLRTRIPEKKA
ncbi:MAG: YtxH domain-containing protein [Anaerolineales bacterium]|nr:MAG: YtxH domain-containing protein [Anaerolineales bacterium]